jgi:acetyl esterase/lipase
VCLCLCVSVCCRYTRLPPLLTYPTVFPTSVHAQGMLWVIGATNVTQWAEPLPTRPPTLVLWGEQDAVFPDYRELLEGLTPEVVPRLEALVLYPRATHWVGGAEGAGLWLWWKGAVRVLAFARACEYPDSSLRCCKSHIPRIEAGLELSVCHNTPWLR